MARIPSYIIKSNLPISGEHWGIEFKEGVAVTEDTALANKLIRKGYAVTCVSPPCEPPTADQPATPTEPRKAEAPVVPVEVSDDVVTEPDQPAETPVLKPPVKHTPAKGARKAKRG